MPTSASSSSLPSYLGTPQRLYVRSDAGPARRPSLRQKLSETLRPSTRNRSSSNLSSYGDGDFLSHSLSLDLQHARAKYACQVVHPCDPPDGVSFRSLPFFILERGRVLEVLDECGHPSTHPDLPLFVDDGEDCLLLVRDERGQVGWALASFLIPLD